MLPRLIVHGQAEHETLGGVFAVALLEQCIDGRMFLGLGRPVIHQGPDERVTNDSNLRGVPPRPHLQAHDVRVDQHFADEPTVAGLQMHGLLGEGPDVPKVRLVRPDLL